MNRLQALYDSEVSFTIVARFDAGFDCAMVIPGGAFVRSVEPTLDAAADWMCAAAIEHYPHCEFSRQYAENVEASTEAIDAIRQFAADVYKLIAADGPTAINWRTGAVAKLVPGPALENLAQRMRHCAVALDMKGDCDDDPDDEETADEVAALTEQLEQVNKRLDGLVVERNRLAANLSEANASLSTSRRLVETHKKRADELERRHDAICKTLSKSRDKLGVPQQTLVDRLDTIHAMAANHTNPDSIARVVDDLLIDVQAFGSQGGTWPKEVESLKAKLHSAVELAGDRRKTIDELTENLAAEIKRSQAHAAARDEAIAEARKLAGELNGARDAIHRNNEISLAQIRDLTTALGGDYLKDDRRTVLSDVHASIRALRAKTNSLGMEAHVRGLELAKARDEMAELRRQSTWLMGLNEKYRLLDAAFKGVTEDRNQLAAELEQARREPRIIAAHVTLKEPGQISFPHGSSLTLEYE